MSISIFSNIKDYETRKQTELNSKIEKAEAMLAQKADVLKSEIEVYEKKLSQESHDKLKEVQRKAEQEAKSIKQTYSNKIEAIKRKATANKLKAVDLILRKVISNV
jgi:vacuolar-type H+-ATPase subunit H